MTGIAAADPFSLAGLFSLAGRVAIVTGATSGIGLATAELLASAGATTVLTGLAADGPDGVASRLAGEGHSIEGLPIEGLPCDVTDETELEHLVDTTVARHGRIDVVVCNAGVALDTGPHTTSTDEQLDRMFDIHVRSVLRLANLVLPGMAAHGGGAFIVMSSIAGLRGNQVIGLYGMTKAANAQLVRNLAVQWGARNIRVNAISPGIIDTGFARPITGDPETARRRLARTPLGRFGAPRHVAGTVLWLASEAGAFVTGQNIVVDGGTLIND